MTEIKAKFQISDKVKSKTEMGMPLEIIGIVNHPRYIGYRCLDTYGKVHEIHGSMLLKW